MHILKKAAMLMSVLAAAFLKLPAQTITTTASGVVIDAGTSEPVPYANILFAGTRLGTMADDEGRFALSNNNSGLNLKVIYEFPIHLQLSFSAAASISDILGYDHSGCWNRPVRAAIGVAYRFR